MPHALTPETAARFAEIALGHLSREYPHKLDHVMDGPEDVLSPRELHPVFFGSFDWHSCVHGWWTMLNVRRLFPALPVGSRVRLWPTKGSPPRTSPASSTISTAPIRAASSGPMAGRGCSRSTG